MQHFGFVPPPHPIFPHARFSQSLSGFTDAERDIIYTRWKQSGTFVPVLAPAPRRPSETTPYRNRYKCPYGDKTCGEKASIVGGATKSTKSSSCSLTTTAGNVLKRFGFHCFRHTLASFLLAQGNSPVLIKNLLRWSKISMLDVYGHVMTDEKIAAQGSMLERIMPKTNAVQ
jgi:hypothetical protein